MSITDEPFHDFAGTFDHHFEALLGVQALLKLKLKLKFLFGVVIFYFQDRHKCILYDSWLNASDANVFDFASFCLAPVFVYLKNTDT
ncbi:MAG TPA: hypothetical protein DDW49_04340 [Deltaproteobacteria bacterium]|nr:hypothetical protein [Deltaproteobacteria bacterium]